MIEPRLLTHSLLDRLFVRGMAWNTGSLFIMGASGLMVSVVIVRAYGVETQGIFFQLLVLQLVAGQVSAIGIQHSVLRFLAINSKGYIPLMWGAIVPVFFSSMILVLILFFCTNLIGHIASSNALALALPSALPGIFLFPINKILLSAINGLRHMRLYAVATGLRYLVIVLSVIAAALVNASAHWVAIGLSLGEIALFLTAITFSPSWFVRSSWRRCVIWGRRHLRFGIAAWPGSVMIDLIGRMDTLMLGLFHDDKTVGIYSFASLISDMLVQLLYVFRMNFDPIIAKIGVTKSYLEVSKKIRHGRNIAYKVSFIIIFLILVAYIPIVGFLIGDKLIAHMSWDSMAIIIISVGLSSGYLAFGGLFQQLGYPRTQSKVIAISCITGLIVGIFAVPSLGEIGAAMMVASANVAFVWIFRRCARGVGLEI